MIVGNTHNGDLVHVTLEALEEGFYMNYSIVKNVFFPYCGCRYLDRYACKM